ncbi:DUF2975 domain-containing protein [Acidomonas methanolica]|uniref:DUF2975 domain-containing protein n=1 Tax=Acidomonas methanolica TaxID=437 RepID=UPI002119D066|nr:DUF2975 domain-containing protein [Acidomonas methanolica]MCQ9156107.1 DUF2975 domain-containing protein [Acidomonas methanolica]
MSRIASARRVARIAVVIVRGLRMMVAFVALLPLAGAIASLLSLPIGLHVQIGVPAEVPVAIGLRVALLAAAYVTLGAIWRVLGLLSGLLATIRDGSPFVRENSDRLTAMAWMLVIMQAAHIAVSVLEAAILHQVSDERYFLNIPIAGIPAVILVFVLAWVFRVGSEMRAELDQVI